MKLSVEVKVAISWVFQKVHTCHVIKIKMMMWYISFTERQGKLKFEVYPFRFVRGEILFQVLVTCEFFEMFNENLVYHDIAFIGQKTDRFLWMSCFHTKLTSFRCHVTEDLHRLATVLRVDPVLSVPNGVPWVSDVLAWKRSYQNIRVHT